MAGKGGWNGLSVQVANSLFAEYSIVITDLKKEEGCYVAIRGGETIRRSRVTECAKAVLRQWFTPN